MPYEWNHKTAVSDAINRGCTVIQTTVARLLLDLDDTNSRTVFEETFPILQKTFHLKILERYRSSGPEGTHVVLECESMSFERRVALQAILGSDRKREALALVMFKEGEGEISFLFKPTA